MHSDHNALAEMTPIENKWVDFQGIKILITEAKIKIFNKLHDIRGSCTHAIRAMTYAANLFFARYTAIYH